MNTARAAYATITVAVVWISTAAAITNSSVSDEVSITLIIAVLTATGLLGVWALMTRLAAPWAPTVSGAARPVVPSSAVSIVAPVEVISDGAEQRVLNCFPSAVTERDWTLDALLEEESVDEASLPDEVDLRADWWKVGNQRSTGSCVGWACADSVLRWHFVTAGRLAETELLSVRYVWMASKENRSVHQTTDRLPGPIGHLDQGRGRHRPQNTGWSPSPCSDFGATRRRC